MALHQLFQLSSVLRSAVTLTLRRNIGISAVLFNRAKELDPVQKLFLDKIRDYNTKSKSVDGTRNQQKFQPRAEFSAIIVWKCDRLLFWLSQVFWGHRGRRSSLPEEPLWGGEQAAEALRRRRLRPVPRHQIHRSASDWLLAAAGTPSLSEGSKK